MIMAQVANDYRRLGAKFDITAYANSQGLASQPFAHLSVVNEHGAMVLHSAPGAAAASFSARATSSS